MHYRKWIQWSYEEEWRILSNVGDVTYSYDSSALCAIYIGWKMSKEDEMVLRKIIGENPIREDGSKKIMYKMQPSETKYKVKPVEIKI